MKEKQNAPAGGEPANGANQNPHVNNTTVVREPFGPVEKIKWLAAASGVRELSRVELALLVVVADMINSSTGQAWPSYNTLADRTGSSPRHTKRAVKRLAANGLLVILEHGNRVRSNRYTLNRSHFMELMGSDAETTTVVTPVSSCSDVEVPEVVTPTPPESIHESEPKAKDSKDRSQADGGASPYRPVGASGLPRRGEMHPEFWGAMGRRTAVAESEQLIREAVADGVEYQDIVDGAKRYARYCADTGGQMKLNAAVWLKKQKWLDDWEFIPAKARTKVVKSASKKKGPKAKGTATRTPTGQPRRKMNPELARWEDIVHTPFYKEEDIWRQSVAKFGRNIPQSAIEQFADIRERHRAFEAKYSAEHPRPEKWIEVTE